MYKKIILIDLDGVLNQYGKEIFDGNYEKTLKEIKEFDVYRKKQQWSASA